MPHRRVDLGLIGFGHVARRFLRLLVAQRDSLQSTYGLTWYLRGIATDRHGIAWHPDGLSADQALAHVEAHRSLTDISSSRPAANTLDFIRRSGANVFIETTPLDIHAGQPAIDHIRAAFQANADVITTNKGPVAFAYRELQTAALKCGKAFRFEGTVMDGVPVFNLVQQTMPCVRITGFRGILNSTTNYVLSRMEEGESQAEALTAMQVAGIAEADASLDLNGCDTAAKVAALINVLLDGETTPHAIAREGISTLQPDDVKSAKATGRRIRLVGSASRTADGQPTGSVHPVVLPATDLLATIAGTSNALILETDLLGELAIVERDPTVDQTAYAVLSDLIAIVTSPARP